MHWDANKIFQLLLFHDSYIERPKIKNLNELSIVKNKTTFSGHGRSYKTETVD